MYGGIEEPKEIKADTKIVPTGDLYSMKLSQSILYSTGLARARRKLLARKLVVDLRDARPISPFLEN